MDIILTGPQGCGKTRASEAVLREMKIDKRDTIHLDTSANALTEGARFRDVRARAIVIEGLDTIEELTKAQHIVSEYRKSIKASVVGIYTSYKNIASMAAVLERPSYQNHTEARTHSILVKLWDRASDMVDRQGAELMLRQANALIPGCVTRPTEDFIALLTIPQRTHLHNFLRDLISEHE